MLQLVILARGMQTTEDLAEIKKTVVKDQSTEWTVGQRFHGIDPVTGDSVSGKILAKAGTSKSRAVNKNMYHIESDYDGWRGCLDLSTLKDLSVIADDTEMVVLFNNTAVSSAKQLEIQTWKNNDVFVEVDNKGQKAISVRWVVTEKIKNGGLITKARLVARGFEENTAALRKDSPTCSKEAVRLLFSIASSKSWKCHTVDVKSAYLQGDEIEREVYLVPPPEFNNGCLWKLNKTVYGLCDAARAWYTRVKN